MRGLPQFGQNRAALHLALMTVGLMSSPVLAAEVQITGKVVSTGGHVNPACRQVFVKRNDTGEVVSLRLNNYTSETSISAITISALVAGLNVFVDYDPAITSGCGAEPTIIYIQLLAN